MVRLCNLVATAATALALECHPEGPLVPRPRQLDKSATFQRALSSLTAILDAAFEGTIRAGFDTQNTSLSFGIVSFDQSQTDIPIWEYHHLSPENVNGTKSINRRSQYLIGSISKAITVCPWRRKTARCTLHRHMTSDKNRMPSCYAAASMSTTPLPSTSPLWPMTSP